MSKLSFIRSSAKTEYHFTAKWVTADGVFMEKEIVFYSFALDEDAMIEAINRWIIECKDCVGDTLLSIEIG